MPKSLQPILERIKSAKLLVTIIYKTVTATIGL